MNAGSRQEVENSFSVDDAMTWFMFKRYNAFLDEKIRDRKD